MIRYIAARLGQGLLTVFLTLSVVFILIRLAPGDPAVAYAGPNPTAESLDLIREQMGLNQPLIVQYFVFLRDMVQGNLGTSYSFGLPALDVVLGRLPNTITLAFAAILITAVVSVPLGVWMARRADTRKELGVNILTITGQSMPDFWIGIMLLSLFAVAIPILPAAGFTSWSGIILPAVTIAILQIALMSRLVRSEMVKSIASPWYNAARSRGVSESGLVWGFGMRNSAIPVITALGTRFAAMLNGVVVVEVVFSWPGIGSLVVRALQTRDYPLIQATVLVTAVLAITVQLLVDLLYPIFDSRVRVGKKVAA
jgi:peptide/nickel transport system permease protein